MDVRAQLEGKKVTVMRIGLLGRGVGDAAFLARNGAKVLVVDDAPQKEMQASVDALRQYENISFKFGPYDLEDFRHADFILKGAGTPLDAPEIVEAEAYGVPVKMSASWFMGLSGLPVVGVTGTRGKSTVTHMLHEILGEAKVPVLLGGNVRGVSTLALLDEATPDHLALFELDSWQCQGFGDEKKSPHLAVFTTFMPDHMNYYKDDMELYLRDKANIFLYQNERDTLVLGQQCAQLVEESFSNRMLGTRIVADEHSLPEAWKLSIPGVHNRYNAALALVAARTLSIPDDVSRKALESFKGVPGRMELVRTVGGVSYYNDTTATTPDATVAALHALPKGKTILIAGGSDKGLVMDEVVAELPLYAKQVLLLAGTGTDTIKEQVEHAGVYTSMDEAVRAASASAQEGDSVVLSPAFASFGMFKNEYDRGDQFTAIVQTL
jgi:UDP-N-acetylmuramoylalanine--D-glutamate ligase